MKNITKEKVQTIIANASDYTDVLTTVVNHCQFVIEMNAVGLDDKDLLGFHYIIEVHEPSFDEADDLSDLSSSGLNTEALPYSYKHKEAIFFYSHQEAMNHYLYLLKTLTK